MLVLADGENHGYAIMQEVAENTQGKMRLGPGSLYGTLKRMLADGWIEETDERPDPKMDDERRRYYRLTGVGRKLVQAEAKRLEQLVNIAREKKLLRNPKPM
jgi:DNA-binding PadR family transcriptional regulator